MHGGRAQKKGLESRGCFKKKNEEWKGELEKRDQYWLNNMGHMKQIFRLMTYEQVNNRAFLESLAKRQIEMIETNAKILE